MDQKETKEEAANSEEALDKAPNQTKENPEHIEEKVTRMGTAPIGKLMLEFAIPAVAAVVLNSIYNAIDSVFLGQAMGEVGLAATTVAFPIMNIVNAFAILQVMAVIL